MDNLGIVIGLVLVAVGSGGWLWIIRQEYLARRPEWVAQKRREIAELRQYQIQPDVPVDFPHTRQTAEGHPAHP